MVQCSLIEVLKDETLSPDSAPSVGMPLLSLDMDVCRPENAPNMRMVSDSCCRLVPAVLLCRTALQRVLTSLSMSSTESTEDSVSYPSSSLCRLQGLREALEAQGVTGSRILGSLTVISF